jgi:hypothetical protein
LKTVTFQDGTSTFTFDSYNPDAFSGTPIETLTINRPLTTSNNSNYQPFAGKTTLKTVTIGSQANTVSNYLFYNCTALQSITNNAATPQTINANVFTGVDKTNCILKVPAASLSQYKAKDVWKEFFVQGVAGNCNNVGDVLSGNSSLGSAVVLKYVSNDVAEIAALPKAGSVFVQWNDDNTQNPRTVSLCNTNFTAQFATCSSSGIESVQSANAPLRVFPNPAGSTLNVELEHNTNGTLALFDLSGRVVATRNCTSLREIIDISRLAAGTYILRLVENGQASAGVKVVKE